MQTDEERRRLQQLELMLACNRLQQEQLILEAQLMNLQSNRESITSSASQAQRTHLLQQMENQRHVMQSQQLLLPSQQLPIQRRQAPSEPSLAWPRGLQPTNNKNLLPLGFTPTHESGILPQQENAVVATSTAHNSQATQTMFQQQLQYKSNQEGGSSIMQQLNNQARLSSRMQQQINQTRPSALSRQQDAKNSPSPMLQQPSTQVYIPTAPLPSQLPPPRQSPNQTRIKLTNGNTFEAHPSELLNASTPGNLPASGNSSAPSLPAPTLLPSNPTFNVIAGKPLNYSRSPRMGGDLHLRTHPDIPSRQELLNKWSKSTVNNSSVPAVQVPQLPTQQPPSPATLGTARKSTGRNVQPTFSVPPFNAKSVKVNAASLQPSFHPIYVTPDVARNLDSLRAFLVAVGQLPPSSQDIRSVAHLDPRRDYLVVAKPDFDLRGGDNINGAGVPNAVVQDVVAPDAIILDTVVSGANAPAASVLNAAIPDAIIPDVVINVVSSDDDMNQEHTDKVSLASQRIALAETQVNMAVGQSSPPSYQDVLMEETTPSSTSSDYHDLQVNPFVLARTEYKCLWEGCTSYLNNLEFLEKHVSVRHCRDASRDPKSGHFYCLWPPCHDRRGFSTKKNIMLHVIHKHLRPLERICLADGCRRVFEKKEGKTQHMAQEHPELMVPAHSLLPEYLKSTPIAVAQSWTTQEKAKFESKKPRPLIPTFDRSLYGGEFPDFDTDPKSWPTDDELQRTKRIKPARGGPGDVIEGTSFQPLGKTFYWREFALEQMNTTVPNVAVELALADKAAGREERPAGEVAPTELPKTQLSQKDTAMDEKSLKHLATLPKQRLADLTWRVMSRSSPSPLSRRASARDLRAMSRELGSQGEGESSDQDQLDSDDSDKHVEDVMQGLEMQADDNEEVDELQDDEL